jgi:hypothetical protein
VGERDRGQEQGGAQDGRVESASVHGLELP